MNCFENLIGIKSDCDNVIPNSGIYIEDIGITADECDSYINAEYNNGLQLIKDKINFSSELIKRTVSNHFNGFVKTKNLLQNNVLGYYENNFQKKDSIPNTLGGIKISLNNNSSYVKIHINTLSLQTDYSGIINILVYNLSNGLLLDTIPVTGVANQVVTINVNKSYESLKQNTKLIFVYDVSSINSFNAAIYQNYCSPCTGYVYSNNYIVTNGLMIGNATPKIDSNTVNSNHTFGLSLNYSIQCSLENWICEVSNLMALPLLYKTGVEIMNYSLYSSTRNNSKQNIDYERNEKRYNHWVNEYNSTIQSVIEKLELPKNDPCFYCDAPIRSLIILP